MLKLNLEYQYSPLTSAHLQLNSTAARSRSEADPRADFDQQTQLDLNLTRHKFLSVAGLDLRFGINNLLNETLKFQSPAATYADDYSYSDGSLLWLQLSYTP
jgi:hypothetical protein